jgi:hypothetical protein
LRINSGVETDELCQEAAKAYCRAVYSGFA